MNTSHGDIVFIHGLGCGGDVWDGLKTQFQAHDWRCWAPTLVEHNRPRARPTNLAPDIGFLDYVADARQHCETVAQQTGRKPVIIGHSLGGLIAQALAIEGACSQAVLVTPAPPKEIVNRSLWVPFLYANVLLSGRSDRYHKAWRRGVDTVLLNRVPKRRHDAIFAAMRFEPGRIFIDMTQGISLEASQLAAPTLIVCAGGDRVVPRKVVQRIADHYRSSPYPCDLLDYPDHGHWIIDEPNNTKFVSDIAMWLHQTANLQIT